MMDTQTETCVIRRAKPEEADLLTELTLRSKAHWGYDNEFMADVRDEMVVMPEQIRVDHVYVLEAGGRICGYYDLEKRDRDTMWLESLFVDPDVIRSGYGRLLLEHALQTARAMGYRFVDFESDPNAERFYLKMGAVRTSARPKPIPGQPDRVLPQMRIVLYTQQK